MPETLARTPLYALHAELGARFTPFAGYDMPVQYKEGLRAEHLHTRAAAGLFDVSHMGQVRVTGPGLHVALERALPVDFDDWPVGRQRYTLLCNERGGIEDDLMVVRLADEVRLVVNASTKEKDTALMQRLCPELSFEPLEDALIALQGPLAERTLRELAPEAAKLSFMSVARLPLAGAECLVSRSGYTGEDGYEISVPAADAERVARALLASPHVKPVGLGARDTLRLEAGLHLYGQDMDANTTVLEASLGWAIARSRRAGGKKQGGFPGAHVYLRESRQGPPQRLVGLIGEDAVPVRHGAQIVSADDAEAGLVTSGTLSPSTGKAIMLASLRSQYGAQAKLAAVVRGTPRPVRVTKLPFVPKRYKA
ncbi:MAG: glycine cleavage system aminomethyltransferase GcvT [Burkholderiales bacterium]